MAEIFRKSSLEKLSSPEQLDKMIVITPPSFWIALAGAGVIIVAALVWSILGRLPINVEATGIYINQKGIHSVYSESGGVVEEVFVKEGEKIKKGDKIARLGTEDIDRKIADYEKRIEAVSKISIDSENDVVTADNKALIDVKNQMITVRATLDQDLELLKLRTSKLSKQRAKTSETEKGFLNTESEYYASLGVGDSTEEQLHYSETQTDYSTVSNYEESAKSSLEQAELNYAQAVSQYKQALGGYDSYDEAMNALKDAENKAKTTLESSAKKEGITIADYSAATLGTELNAGAYDSYSKVKNAVIEYLSACQSSEALASNQSTIENYKAAVEQAKSTKDSCQKTADQYTEEKKKAGQDLDDARTAYTNKTQEMTNGQQQQSRLGNEYNKALNEYTAKKSELSNLEDTVEQLVVQVEVDQKNVDAQMKVINEQFAATKASVCDQLESEYKQCLQEKEKATLKATVDGLVTNISVVEGSILAQGNEVARVQQGKAKDRAVVCYIPVSSGKKIKKGMEVMVYPTTVNKQEYGHMEAVVKSVDGYLTSSDEMQKQLGNENLVESFLQNGPVVKVTCTLREDDTTASGYFWSSKKGKDVSITAGTMVEANIVTEKKAPITMLIPLLKEKLTIRSSK